MVRTRHVRQPLWFTLLTERWLGQDRSACAPSGPGGDSDVHAADGEVALGRFIVAIKGRSRSVKLQTLPQRKIIKKLPEDMAFGSECLGLRIAGKPEP
jgi:hypothetical protein